MDCPTTNTIKNSGHELFCYDTSKQASIRAVAVERETKSAEPKRKFETQQQTPPYTVRPNFGHTVGQGRIL
jgi:hypothetical protein